MKDIRLIVQEILDNYFNDEILVVAEELISEKDLPSEYIVYRVVSENFTAFANNKPIQQKSNVDVAYFCIDINNKLTRIQEITKVMLENNFKLVSMNSDLQKSKTSDSLDKDSNYYGTVQEFVLFRGVAGEY